MDQLRVALAVAYLAPLALLALLALHRLVLVALLAVHRRPARPAAGELPFVTIQLPVCDEATVVGRALDACAALDWPKERLEVQVLDDSTDETSAIVAARARELAASGLTVHHVRRGHREGFKAGALAHGLESARGELVAVFDADFAPVPGFLRETTPWFQDPRVGCVQAPWEHVNRGASLLTRVQALLLDAHFLVEQTARARSGRPFKFNGTAGVFRRAAILDAGSWSSDTLTEDLDLSVRAQLRGWRFAFASGTAAAGELPEDIAAFRSQQRRWVKGSAQTARKLLGRVLASDLGVAAKLELGLQLLANAVYPLVLALALLTVPLVAIGSPRRVPEVPWAHLGLFVASTASVAAFLVASQVRRGWRGVLEALLLMPFVFGLGVGLSLSNARSFLSGLVTRGGPFVRTPKRGDAAIPRYRPVAANGEALLELAIALYFGFGTFLAATSRRPLPSLPFQLLLLAGFLAVGLKTLTRGLSTKFPVTNSLA